MQALLEDARAVLEVALLEDGLQHPFEAAEVDRLLDVVGRAELDRLDRVLHGRVPAHEHELDVRVAVLQVAQQLEPAHPGHADVGQDHVNGLLVERRQRRIRAVRDLHLEALLGEKDLEDLPDVRIVLHDEDLRPVRSLAPVGAWRNELGVVHGLAVHRVSRPGAGPVAMCQP